MQYRTVTIDSDLYKELKKISLQKNTTLTRIFRKELPVVIERTKQQEYEQIMNSTRRGAIITKPVAPIKDEKRSLKDLCLDLIELDLDAPENKEYVDAKMNQLGTKVDSYIALDKFADANIEMLMKEVEHLSNQVRSTKKLQDKLRNYALFAMDAANVTQLKSEVGHSISIRESKSVEITDPTKLPSWAFHEVKPVKPSPDKKKIKEAIEEGESVDGAFVKVEKYVVFK